MSENTIAVQSCIDRITRGDSEAKAELIQVAYERLQRMTRKMKRDFDRVGRWEQTDDIFQNASLRLCAALEQVDIIDARHFFRLAAVQIRRELIDLDRHYHGPQGMGANHHTQMGSADQESSSAMPPAYDAAEVTSDPGKMQQWSEFHQAVEELPQREREVFELLWYHELPQDQVAELLNVSTRQIKRLWRAAKLSLHDRLHGEVPD